MEHLLSGGGAATVKGGGGGGERRVHEGSGWMLWEFEVFWYPIALKGGEKPGQSTCDMRA